MKLRKLALACAAIPAALFLTGCGSDDSSSNTVVGSLYTHAGSGATTLPVTLYRINSYGTWAFNAGATSGAAGNLYTNNLLGGYGFSQSSSVSNLVPTQTGLLAATGVLGIVPGSATPNDVTFKDYSVVSGQLDSESGTATPVINSSFWTTGVSSAAAGITTVSGQTKNYMVFAGSGASENTAPGEGNVLVANSGAWLGFVVPAGNNFSGDSIVDIYDLATSGGNVNDEGGTLDVAINSGVSSSLQPIIYQVIDSAGNNSQVNQCTVTFNANFVPSIAYNGDSKCVVNSNFSEAVSVAVAANNSNVIIVDQATGTDTIYNCIPNNWALAAPTFGVPDQFCKVVVVDYPAGVTGDVIHSVKLTPSRNVALINTVNVDNVNTALACAINNDGTTITGCTVIRKNGSATGAVISLPANSKDTLI